MKCPIDVRRMIRNAHVNLGHPSNHALVRLMRTAKCHPDMVAYARHMKCPSCARRKPLDRIPRVSLPYRPTRFNAVVGLDLKWVKDSKGEQFYCLNIIDLATAFNVCCLIPDKTPQSVANAFKLYWMNWAGTPEKVIADKGREYYTDFQSMLSDLGILYRLVPVEAPWQLGIVERHGQVLADIISVTVAETGVVGFQQMQDVCLHTCMVKNRRPGRTGYSPRSLVFGVDERLVASGLTHYLEVPDDAAIAASNDDPVFKKSMEIRKSAMRAIIDLDHSEKWREAIKFLSRKSECAMFLPGHQVFFWKKAQQASNLRGHRARIVERWYGPGVVIGHEWDQQAQRDSYWVSYGGKCFLVAGTHMRHAEFEECLSQEKFIEELKTAFDAVQTPTFQYSDVRIDQESPEEVIGQTAPTMTEGDRRGLLSAMSQASPAAGVIFPTTSHAPSTAAPPSRRIPGTASGPMIISPQPEPAQEPLATSTPVRQSPLTGTSPSSPSRIRQLFPEPSDENFVAFVNKAKDQRVFTLRGNNHCLIVDDNNNECYFLKWKTFNKMQRKGKELDPKYFNEQERAQFTKSDAKEWQSFLTTGAVVVISPEDAQRIPQSRIFQRPMRFVRTNKNKDDAGPLEAKSRIVTPGDVDPDGDIPVEDGGFRTDAPTCPQLAFHMLCSQAVLRKRKLGTFDCKTAFLTGKEHDRDIYCRPPKEGLPGIKPGSLLKLVKGAYGLREAPRLWYLKAREVMADAGFEEMQTAKACFVLFDRSGPEPINVGMLVLHVDDACYAGEGPIFEKAMKYVRSKFTIGKEEFGEFDFLGRHVIQRNDYTIEIDQHTYIDCLQSVAVSKERRTNPKATLTPKELHDYRSIVGQLAWPARETMPMLSYSVSDLQQRVSQATVHDLVHANNILNLAKRWCKQQNAKLVFRDLGPELRLDMQHSRGQRFPKASGTPTGKLGLAAVHDASFMQQLNDGSQSAYCLMLCSTKLYEGVARTHLLDWGSSKIHRKVRSTLAAEAASATRAFDRGAYARVMLYEINHGWTNAWNRFSENGIERRQSWEKMCSKIPFSLGTDCKSLYDVCTKNGSMPDERRVALDLLDIRESIEEMGDQIRWIPTDHMLVDCMTKTMPPDVMLKYMKTGEYAFKYDEVIRHTKRELAKARKALRSKTTLTPEKCDDALSQDVNIVQHYDFYYDIFSFLYCNATQDVNLIQWPGDYKKLRHELEFRDAYFHIVDSLFSSKT